MLVFFVSISLISIFSIPPTFMEKGVIVKSVTQNSSIFNEGLRAGMVITEINGNQINTVEDYTNSINLFPENSNETQKITIKTKDLEIIGLFSREIIEQVSVSDISKTRIKTGLDLQGGARALVTAQDIKLTDEQLDDLISVSQERLNVYGLTDIQLQKVSDLSGNKFMLVEIAGSTPSDLEELLAKQGKFEAKIGNETVFIGGNEDITYVGRSGQDAAITECNTLSPGSEICRFQFVIYLTEEAAQRHAKITSNLSTNITSGGKYLEKTIDFYLDEQLTESLNIGSDLKGKVATQIQISGSGQGATRQEAIDNAKLEMKKLQTILITGSLPFKLKIEKIDRISPKLGNDFTREILLAGILAVIAVSAIVFIRYRKLKISLAIILVSFSEIIIILGVAALIKWNLDLPSIAGIIATIGTGVDSQLVILDEARIKGEAIRQKIKNALFIIVSAFATSFVSLVPLTGALGFIGIGAASAGLLKGFAITTLIGITAGIIITRPAFADIVKQFEED